MPNKNRLLYKQVMDYILAKIEDRTFKFGEAIPPERELCQELTVSRYTVRKAIQELVRDGYLYRVQGNGTFVFEKTHIFNQNMIGVIMPYCNAELEMAFLSGIQKGLENESYSMTFLNSNDDYQKEAENIYRFKNEGVAGLIIMPAEDQKDSTAISDLKAEQFPFILLDRRLGDCETDCVMSDNIEGGYKAVEHLIELGHKRIAFITHKLDQTSSVEDRIIGYKKAMLEYGLNELSIFSYSKTELDQENIDQIYNFIVENEPTAVVAVSDYIALDIVKMCRKKNIRIPGDLSIVGFDNQEVVKHLEVPLTSIAQFPQKMGVCALRMLIQKINSKPEDESSDLIHQIYYPTELIIRESSTRLTN